MTTLAGTPMSNGYRDGDAEQALFSRPMGIDLGTGEVLYIADSFNHVIRKVTTGRKVETFAGTGYAGKRDGPRETSFFRAPSDLAVTDDRTIYSTDTYNFQVRRIDTGGTVTTLAGSGVPGYRDGRG